MLRPYFVQQGLDRLLLLSKFCPLSFLLFGQIGLQPLLSKVGIDWLRLRLFKPHHVDEEVDDNRFIHLQLVFPIEVLRWVLVDCFQPPVNPSVLEGGPLDQYTRLDADATAVRLVILCLSGVERIAEFVPRLKLYSRSVFCFLIKLFPAYEGQTLRAQVFLDLKLPRVCLYGLLYLQLQIGQVHFDLVQQISSTDLGEILEVLNLLWLLWFLLFFLLLLFFIFLGFFTR